MRAVLVAIPPAPSRPGIPQRDRPRLIGSQLCDLWIKDRVVGCNRGLSEPGSASIADQPGAGDDQDHQFGEHHEDQGRQDDRVVGIAEQTHGGTSECKDHEDRGHGREGSYLEEVAASADGASSEVTGIIQGPVPVQKDLARLGVLRILHPVELCARWPLAGVEGRSPSTSP